MIYSNMFLDGFEDYVVDTTETPVSYIILTGVFVSLLILFSAPLACWKRHRHDRFRRRRLQQVQPIQHDILLRENKSPGDLEDTYELTNLQRRPSVRPTEIKPPDQKVGDLALFHREHLAAMKQYAQSMQKEKQKQQQPPPAYFATFPFDRKVSDRCSNSIPSIASTSRIHGVKRHFRTRMPFGRTKPLPREITVLQSLAMERQSQTSWEDGSQTHSRSRLGWQSQPASNLMMSEGSGSLSFDRTIHGDADFFRNVSRYRRLYRSSIGGSDTPSIMPPLDPDALSPEDAADANDPGKLSNPTQFESRRVDTSADSTQPTSADATTALIPLPFDPLDLAEPDYEVKRIIVLAVPSTVSAMADPFFRIVLMAIVSHFIDSDSMVAYVLVILFIRLTTEEISGAITDAESNALHDALIPGGEFGFFQAGQTIQLALLCQLFISIPILLVWCFFMEDVVLWLVAKDEIARVASDYAGVIIIDYILRGATKTFMLPLYMTGQADFEAKIDVVATILTMVAIAVVSRTNDLSLREFGWIQVIICIAKTIVKVAFAALKGYLKPYQAGFFGRLCLRDTSSVTQFVLQALPLFLGSLMELGEWEMLVFFVSYLGGAEVAVWSMMGVIWEFFTALTEGLGEAASVRVSFYLAEGAPLDASRLANKVTFLTFVLALTISSIFLMAGPNISVALTKDNTLQNLFSNLVGMTSLANVSMTFSQIYWSLAGAQGRFNMASATILSCRWFLILPLASICIFGYRFDLVAVACAMAIGYAVAASTLAMFVFQSDWEKIARELRDDIEPMNCYPIAVPDHREASSDSKQNDSDHDDDDEEEEDDNDEESDDSSSHLRDFEANDQPSDEDDDPPSIL